MNNLPQSIVNGVILLYNFFEIFLVMYFGNEIKLSSHRLSYSLFESNWIEESKSLKKSKIILIELLKQPQELVISICAYLHLTVCSFSDLGSRLQNVQYFAKF